MEVRVRWRRSASAPLSTVRPARMIVTRSQSASTSLRMWLDSSTVVPLCRSSSMASRNAASISGSRPDVGSSRMSSSAPGRERRDQRHLLPVALGVGAGLAGRVEVEPLQEQVLALAVQPAAQPAEQVDHLAAGQVRPQRDVAGHVGEPPVQGGRLPPRIAAEQARGAGVGAQQAEQDPQGRRLAGAVRPQEAVHLTVGHGQVEPVQRARLAEVLHQAGHFDCHRHASYHTLNSENHESSERTLPPAACPDGHRGGGEAAGRPRRGVPGGRSRASARGAGGSERVPSR